ncbi:nucleotidyl transferase AbiEii/AbiGii toxin family protein [Winogradskyella sediminis]|uniref:nucleotidyl transferase AbiEii/AbiGii toxin family protein n=1 Tax=Winogradskyella sediminis TaxID=1382466 RepID=UPI000E2307DA|nr:nucleotidyl transferase AbiEii/AbiGii toxin family protein [Winogradskyella sediminis]REG87874.1 nucleotidyltransferase AbiEii toxin of type IV toxin-antitoxin system [Winogradskyella sediminis]
MQAVSSVLLKTIKELQALPSLSKFALAGGTNLALRFNHRISEDIDLFSTEIIGIKGFKSIEKEAKAFYGKNLTNVIYPVNINDQFVDLRFYISKGDVTIKIDIIQNMKALYPVEVFKEIRCYNVVDIGLFKLISCSNRPAKKDIYDLDHITESNNLIDLYKLLQEKKAKFNKDTDRNIFDLDEEPDPIDNPHLLLLFDRRMASKQKMRHSHDNILHVEGSKSWQMASIHWRMKVRRLYASIGIEYPKL